MNLATCGVLLSRKMLECQKARSTYNASAGKFSRFSNVHALLVCWYHSFVESLLPL